MAIPIDENILLFALGSIFIPVIISFIKLMGSINDIKNRLEHVSDTQEKNRVTVDFVNQLRSEVNGLKIRIEYLERDQNTRAPLK